MKNYKILSVFSITLLLALTSCGGKNNPVSPSIDGSNVSIGDSTTSGDSVSSPSEPSVNEPSVSDPSTSEPLPVITYATIKEVKTIAESLTNENPAGVANSEDMYRIKGSIIADLTSGTTKAGYGEQYKLLVLDSTATLYVRASLEQRENLQMYLSTNEIIEFVGHPSLYRKTAELELIDFTITAELQEDYQSSVAEKLNSFASVYSKIDELVPNCKGTSFGNLYEIEGFCLQKTVASDKNMIFIDNANSLFVYDNIGVFNSISEGQTYKFIGAIQIYQFRPSFVITKLVSVVKDSTITYDNFLAKGLVTSKTASDFYSQKPRTDLDADSYETYPQYSGLFGKMYKVNVNVNISSSSSGKVMLVGDIYKETEYTSLVDAAKDKQLVLNNGSESKLSTEQDFNNSKLYPYYYNSKKISINIFPYEYRNGFFKIEGYLNSIQEIVA